MMEELHRPQFLINTKLNWMFISPEENNTELPPVPFYPFFPLYTLKVTDIPLKINRCNDKKKKKQVKRAFRSKSFLLGFSLK